MDEEIVALDVNKTWELMPLPKGKKAIGCKWVYKVKHKADGTIERYKARVIAKEYAQTYGIDYEETFAPVAKMATICTVIVVAIAKGWFMHQIDVKNAFLQGSYKKKCIWSSHLVMKMSDAGFVLITIYVDDLIIVGDSEIEIEHVKGLLKKEFEMKDLGELRYFLGLDVICKTEKPHLDAVYCTLCYVRATLDHALFYAVDVPVKLQGHTDADWAGTTTDRRSTSRFMFTLGSAAITWSSKKQPIVALPSIEVEYRGAAVACEIAWLHKLPTSYLWI
ncbi:hypothetical protein L7F22_001737 [Adiantum nelumboides]|nr:hypothetical protein [Adiantum nelumboides]